MRFVQQRPYRSLLIGMGLVVLLAFLAAIGVSKIYWGYYIRRPGLDRRMLQIERVHSLTAVHSERRPDGVVELVFDDPHHVYDHLDACRDERPSQSYYCLGGRVLVALTERGKLPAASERLSAGELGLLYDRLESTGKLVDGAPGYDHAKELTGLVLETEGRGGGRYLFVAARGRQVSNDHYPYYEFLFRVPDRDAEPRLLSYRRFYYDVAGMEGAEWPVAFVALLLLGALLLALVLAVRAAIDTYRGRDALRTVTAVTALVLLVALTLVFGLGGCSVLRSGPTPASATTEPTATPAATATLASTSNPTPTPVVVPTRTALPTPTPSATPTPTSSPTPTSMPTATPEPTHTGMPVPLSRIESIPGSVVLYVEGDGLRSIPHRSLFEHPDLQHVYGSRIGDSNLAMYLIGGSPIPSPDGRYALITSPLPSGPDIQPGTTWLGDLQTGELTPLGPPALAATWSPDGRRLTYVLDETLYVWDVEGDEGPVAVFQREDLRRWYARWSPAIARDGSQSRTWIAVASREGPEDRTRPVAMEAYWLVSPDGSTVKHLGTWLAAGMGVAPQSLDWSPDGSMLDTPSAVVVTVDGQELRYDEIFENPPPSAPARYDARFIDPALIPDRRDAWMSHDEQQIAYEGHDGLYLFDRRSQTHVLLATFDVVDPQRVHWATDDRTLLVGSRDRARGEDGTFWGQILAFKPGDGSAPELLVEGKDVYLVGVAPDVLDDSRPKATPTVEVPFEETPEATPTPRIPEPVPTRAVIEMLNLAYEGIGLTFDQPIAETVQAEMCPARIDGELFTVPTHACFSFSGYVLPDAAHAPRIEVYPVADYEVRNRHVPETIVNLRQLLSTQPAAPKSIPFLPTMDAGQMLRAQVAYLDFEGGSGVRFLTQYGHEPREINSGELFYTFQGITDDGHAYVSAFLPVSHPSLPVHLGTFRDAPDTGSWRYDEYIAWIEDRLNAQDASSFTPNLDQLDAIIRSLKVGPRCPSAVPPVTEEREGPYHGWGKAVNKEYGFVLRYPPSWALKEVPGQILFCQDRFVLRIAYRRQGEDWIAHWTGIPAGDVEERGRIPVPGGEVIRRDLVFEDKLKVLLYRATVGDLEVSALLDDEITLQYRDVELPEDLRDQVDQILGSLEGL